VGGTPRQGEVIYRGPGLAGTPDSGVNAYAWTGSLTFGGDSGSAVRLSTGLAAGNLTHPIVYVSEFLGATVAGTSIERMLELAGKPLATAPTVVPVTS